MGVSENCLLTGLSADQGGVRAGLPSPISDHWMLGAADGRAVSSPLLFVSGQRAVYLLN